MRPMHLFSMGLTLLSMACISDKEEGPEGMGGQEGEAFDLDGGPPGNGGGEDGSLGGSDSSEGGSDMGGGASDGGGSGSEPDIDDGSSDGAPDVDTGTVDVL